MAVLNGRNRACIDSLVSVPQNSFLLSEAGAGAWIVRKFNGWCVLEVENIGLLRKLSTVGVCRNRHGLLWLHHLGCLRIGFIVAAKSSARRLCKLVVVRHTDPS